MTLLTDAPQSKPIIKVVPEFNPARFIVHYNGVGGDVHTSIPEAMREARAIAAADAQLREMFARMDPPPMVDFLEDIFPEPFDAGPCP